MEYTSIYFCQRKYLFNILHVWPGNCVLYRDTHAVFSSSAIAHVKTHGNRLIGLVGRVFANGPVDLGSIPGRFIPKTLKMVLDTSLLNTQQYKVCIKGKVEKSRERSSALPDTSVYSLLKRETSGRPRLRSPTLCYKKQCYRKKTQVKGN